MALNVVTDNSALSFCCSSNSRNVSFTQKSVQVGLCDVGCNKNSIPLFWKSLSTLINFKTVWKYLALMAQTRQFLNFILSIPM